MSKRTKLILSLILSILVLVYTIADYTGFLRKAKINHYQPESYLANYRNLEKADAGRVILVFSGFSKDRDRSFINSILDQTVKVDDIIAVVPGDVQVPNYITPYKSVESPLICSLAREGNAKTKMIFILKKKIFDKTFLQDILEAGENTKSKISSDFILTTPELCEKELEVLQRYF